MGGPSKPFLIAYFSVVALFVGVGGYLVFTRQMDSYQFMMIGVTVGTLGALFRLTRR
jgi:hypothetical protein